MGRVRLNEETGIPLFLLPHAIALQIKKRGDLIYRISVKRTCWHHYNVSVRIKSLPRELASGCGTVVRSPALPGPGKRGVAGGEGSA